MSLVRLFSAALPLALWLGLSVPASLHAAVHTVGRGENLTLIAKRYAVEPYQLRRWNSLPSDVLHVGQKLRVRADGTVSRYTVRRGDNLSTIARRFAVPQQTLRRLNDLRSDRLAVGQKLRLEADAPPPAAPVVSAGPPAPTQAYTVRRGDNLSTIAQRFGMGLDQLRRINNLRSDRLAVGQKLQVAAKEDAPAKTPAAAPRTRAYTVRRGDTLSEIALRFGMALNQLRRINDLRSDKLAVGQKLQVLGETYDPEDEPTEYVVRRGDNLSTIARRFDVGLGLLRRINNLRGDRINPGQRLLLRPDNRDEGLHTVRRGETLSQIARAYGMELDRLRALNGIEGSRIYVGQQLRLQDTPSATHIVERGDALWEIARAYGMELAELKRLNDLESDRILPGQRLKLNPQKAERLASYTVRRGDNLTEIARLHQMSVSQLRKLNNLRRSVIHPGDRLKVKPLLGGAAGRRLDRGDWQSLFAGPQGVRSFTRGDGPYFYRAPRAAYQKSTTYYENAVAKPLQTYRQARSLWKSFEAAVSRLGREDNALAGWHFVLDPGHGGTDPGTVVPTRDSGGKTVYVVEDEYVYDIALRLYVLLRRHGAEVTLTLLSPNHLIRRNNPVTRTFANEKNEVYNSYSYNRRNGREQWPRGGRGGNLDVRVDIARHAFAKAPRGRRVFLSLHADRTPKAPRAPLVLYYEGRNSRNRDLRSRAFAKTLLPALGAGSRTRGQSLGVLRRNPADYKLLLEMRNLAYADHAWALRYEEMRQRDAEKVVKGLLDFARQQNRQARR